MRKISVKELNDRDFKQYGVFCSVTEPSGNHFGTFYADNIPYAASAGAPITFSPLVCGKSEKMIVSGVEYHNYAFEGIVPIDDDVVIHVALPSKGPVPELTEAFLVPKGTAVVLKPGVWHEAPMPVDHDAHVLIILPERTYQNDCVYVNYGDEDAMEIAL